MQLRYTERFRRSYVDAPKSIQQAFDRKVALFLRDYRHPSLNTKKYDKHRGLWQARVTKRWRFYFTIEDDTYSLIDLIPHPK